MRIQSILLFGAILGSWGCHPSRVAVFQKINQEVLAHSEGYRQLERATQEIGHRLTGSENGRRAEDLAFTLFTDYGLSNVQKVPFQAPAWVRGEVHFGIKTDPAQEGWQEIRTVALALTPASSLVDAELWEVGNGLRADFEANQTEIKGKIAVMNLPLIGAAPGTKNLHRSEKVALAQEFGAVGVVFINGVDGNVLLTGTASVDGEPVGIPAVCIGKEDGALLRSKLNLRLWAHISMENTLELVSANNIVGEIPGKGPLQREVILVGGHLDSWDLSTGAIDNGIGSFSVMDMARTLSQLKENPRRTIRFCLFMGEEQGLLGSKAYCENLKSNGSLENVRMMMNLDMAGNAIGFDVSGRPEMDSLVRSIGMDIRGLDTLFRNKVTSGVGLHSDHQPFMLEGIPILGVNSNLDPGVYKYYHAEGDDFSLVNKAHMENGIRFSAMMVWALANAPVIPAGKLKDPEIKEFLQKNGLEEKLKIQKEWRWEE